jgi:purine nucleosidase
MQSRKIIIDCDPGQDDAVALLLACASPAEFEIAGITCVAGNVPLQYTTRNALRIGTLAGRTDIPIFAGCPRPMLRRLETAEAVHGTTGLDGVDLPEPAVGPDPRHAVDFLIEAARASSDKGLTLCPIGPMTNIAMALIMAPEIVPKIREIVFMGGVALGPGNVTPSAEFNVYVDPHAAKVVLESGIALTMLGLDVTHKAVATPARRALIEAVGTPAATAVGQMLTYYDRCDIERYGAPGAPLHDPCVIAYLLRPELFDGKACHVEVEVADGPGLGRTVVDWWGRTEASPNCRVITEIDADAFFDLLAERLGKV